MSTDLAIGQEFGNYRLTQLVGRGGFAEVYLGEHVYLKTQAAIKVLQTHLEQEEQERFYDEARTIAHLQHEHIVRVLEFGLNDDSIPYLVMEYAPNGTLRERFPKGTAVSVEHILPPLKQVAVALNYAHNENLVHRDIKPENMLLGTHNEVLLSDFGIALMISGSRRQGAQDVAGTITYMAPEQLLGHPTKTSDQYALGVEHTEKCRDVQESLQLIYPAGQQISTVSFYKRENRLVDLPEENRHKRRRENRYGTVTQLEGN